MRKAWDEARYAILNGVCCKIAGREVLLRGGGFEQGYAECKEIDSGVFAK